MARLDEIRESLEECQKYGGFVEGYISADDVSYLLERIDELERENKDLEEQLAREIETAIEYRRADDW